MLHELEQVICWHRLDQDAQLILPGRDRSGWHTKLSFLLAVLVLLRLGIAVNQVVKLVLNGSLHVLAVVVALFAVRVLPRPPLQSAL